MITDVDSHGGAALIANGMSDRWLGGRNDVFRRYIARRPNDPRPKLAIPQGRLKNYIIHEAGKAHLPSLFRSISRSMISNEVKAFKPDVISLHNIHAADETHDLVGALTAVAPVVWTLHDMWSFTGRCAYSGPCTKFLDRCDEQCPTPDVRPSLPPHAILREWQRRQEFFGSVEDVVAVSPSRWLADKAKSGLWRDRVQVINNGVDLSVFHPISQRSARDALGIPQSARVVAAYVANKGDPFKTPEHLESALSMVERPLHVLTFGPGHLELPCRHTRVDLGTVSSRHLLAIAYAAADFFVLSSLHENFPTVLLEALACGTPSVAFDIGGVPEILDEHKVGIICDSSQSGRALAAGMEQVIDLSASEKEELRRRCREVAEARFDVARQSEEYIRLFRKSLRA